MRDWRELSITNARSSAAGLVRGGALPGFLVHEAARALVGHMALGLDQEDVFFFWDAQLVCV